MNSGEMGSGELFRGWYFKHQNAEETLSFIPGESREGAFIQLVGNSFSACFDFPRLRVEADGIHVGKCIFSNDGCLIDLPAIQGQLNYGPLTPLKSDIMGPLRRLPLQCRHIILSMGHRLSGSITLGERVVDFNDGRGYIEGDSGRSFPRSYTWLHCNSFLGSPEDSITLAIADIPLLGGYVTGCICPIIHQGQELRLASYLGVRVIHNDADSIILKQRKYLLQVEIDSKSGQRLSAPLAGRMLERVDEDNAAQGRFRLWEHGRKLFDYSSNQVSYERRESSSLVGGRQALPEQI